MNELVSEGQFDLASYYLELVQESPKMEYFCELLKDKLFSRFVLSPSIFVF